MSDYTINNLTDLNILAAADELVIWDGSAAATKKVDLTTLRAFIQAYDASVTYPIEDYLGTLTMSEFLDMIGSGAIAQGYLATELSAEIDKIEVIETLLEIAGGVAGRIDDIEDNADALLVLIQGNDTDISSLTATYNALNSTVQTNSTSISTNATAISLRATQASLDLTDGEVDVIQAELALYANQFTVKIDSNGAVAGMGLIIYDTWNESDTYSVDDYVWGDTTEEVYICILEATDVEPGVDSGWATYWTLVPYGAQSEFAVLANKFQIMNYNDSGDVITPFVVSGANVGIAGNLIVNGTIVAAALNAGSFGTFTLSATDKIVINSADGLEIESGGDLNIKSGGVFDVESGGAMTFSSGGALTLNSGSSLTITGSSQSITMAGGVIAIEGPVAFGDADNEHIKIESSQVRIKDGSTVISYFDQYGAHSELQPSVLAIVGSTIEDVIGNGSYTIPFGTEVFDQGADFSSTTFTAPCDGLYQISFKAGFSGMSAATGIGMTIVTSNRSYLNGAPVVASGAYGTSSVTADMDQGDTLYVTVSNTQEGSNIIDIVGSASPYTWLSITMVS